MNRIVWLGPTALLFLAILPMPYGYYTVLRFVVSISAAIICFNTYQKDQELRPWVIMFGLIAILFNPLIPVHLTRSIWAPIDIICGLVFLAHLKITGNEPT